MAVKSKETPENYYSIITYSSDWMRLNGPQTMVRSTLYDVNHYSSYYIPEFFF